jgi:oligoribonuclease NrnB/cAMP/cGMP phosphodiesterase (DHH superfamily)
MSIKVYYHSGDLDGWCSGAIVKKFYQDQEIEVEMLPINYGDKFLWDVITPDDTVYMVDFSLPMEEMDRINEKVSQNFIWIDHHLGAIRDYENTPSRYLAICGNRSPSVAACELTWTYFYRNISIPTFIKLLSDFDVWRHDGKYSWDYIENFQYGFKAKAKDPKIDMKFWEDQFWVSQHEDEENSSINCTQMDGKLIKSYIEDRFRSELASRSYKIYWEGHKCLVINSDPYIANFMTRCNEFTDCDIAINYCNNGGKSWIVNLRTNKKEIDLSEIAKLYKGGGHKSASGFNCRELPFEVLV